MIFILVLLFRLAWVWGYCYQTPGLLITYPSKLMFCEAFVSQIKTLLEPKVVADGYLWIFFFLLEVDWNRGPHVYPPDPCSSSCAPLQVAVWKMCCTEILSVHGFLKTHVLAQTLVTAAAFLMCKRRKAIEGQRFLENHCTNSYFKLSFAVILLSLQHVMVQERC